MNKEYILEEIKRTAALNGGLPLGRERFHKETGIRTADWEGKFWVNWGDAVREAGFEPNKLQKAYHREQVIEMFIFYIRELGRFPVKNELKLKARRDAAFPSATTFDAHLGSTVHKRNVTVREYCSLRPGYEDILALCSESDDSPDGGLGQRR